MEATEGMSQAARETCIVTPQRRGVGPMSLIMLLQSTLQAYETRMGS
jgi:5,10-methylene-tetrahydrofolate dehydrogenase/methenyl tetrahydrofolate cyclohydrolase